MKYRKKEAFIQKEWNLYTQNYVVSFLRIYALKIVIIMNMRLLYPCFLNEKDF